MMKQSLIPHTVAIVLTRPEQNSVRFAQSLRAALPQDDLKLIFSPLMAPEFLSPKVETRAYQELILTSETGAVAAGRLRRAGTPLPQLAICVGERTAQIAQDQGFDAISAQGDARDLLALILARPDPGPMLYLHGQDRAADLELLLKGQRDITGYVVYQQKPIPLNAIALEALAEAKPLIVPLFSPRSARLFTAELPAQVNAALYFVTISANTTAALPKSLPYKVIEADHPDAAAMMRATSQAITQMILDNDLKPNL